MKPHTITIPKTGEMILAMDENYNPRAVDYGSITVDQQGMFGILEAAGIKRGDIAFDIGAFIGDSARMMIDYGCRVWAFEPFQDAFFCLVHNCPEAQCFQYPMGNGDAVALNYIDIRGYNFGMRYVERTNEPDAFKSVKLDALTLPLPDFIKIDVEGYEVEVLRGAKETILRKRPAMFIEYYPELLDRYGHKDALFPLLDELGYSVDTLGTAPRWDLLCIPKH